MTGPSASELILACEMSGLRESLVVRKTHHNSLEFKQPGNDDWSVLVGPGKLRALRSFIDDQLAAEARDARSSVPAQLVAANEPGEGPDDAA